MKKSSYSKILLTVLALAGAQSAGAAVLAGFYDFNGVKAVYPGPPAELAGEVTPGFIGWVESPLQASSGSNGSTDGFYGNSGTPVGTPTPAIGDGMGSIKMFSTGSSTLKFTLTNNTGYAVKLSDLFFDGAATTGQANRYVKVDFINSLGTTPLGVFGSPALGLGPSSNKNYDDFGVSLGDYMMANSETVSFVFSAPVGSPLGTVLMIDNVAVVPEPGSLMVFGTMVLTGLMYRSRRS